VSGVRLKSEGRDRPKENRKKKGVGRYAQRGMDEGLEGVKGCFFL